MEIDDRWQAAYGDLEFDKVKFPDAPGMVRQLHAMGFKVTVWVMPFVEENSEAYRCRLLSQPRASVFTHLIFVLLHISLLLLCSCAKFLPLWGDIEGGRKATI